MAIVAAFGNLTFEVASNQIKQFKNLKQTVGFRSDNNENKGTKPSTVRKGPDLQRLTFDIVFDATLGVDVSVEKQKWIDVSESGVPYFFTVSGGRISKFPFICKSVEVTYEDFNGMGKPIKISLSISLEEYVKEGQEETTTSSAVSTSSGIDSSVEALLNTDTSKTRINPARQVAVKKGWYH